MAYSEHHGPLNNPRDSGICEFEQSTGRIDIANVAFGLGHLASMAAAALHDPGRCLVVNATPAADDDMSSAVYSHMDSQGPTGTLQASNDEVRNIWLQLKGTKRWPDGQLHV